MQPASFKATPAKQASNLNDGCQLYGRRVRHSYRGRPNSEIHFCQEIRCSHRIWIEKFHAITAQSVHIRQRVPS